MGWLAERSLVIGLVYEATLAHPDSRWLLKTSMATVLHRYLKSPELAFEQALSPCCCLTVQHCRSRLQKRLKTAECSAASASSAAS